MKKISLSIVILLVSGFIALFSQSVTGSFNPATGDAQLDVTIREINVEAHADLDAFVAEVSVTYQVPEEEVTVMLVEEKMEPAEVFLAVELAEISEKSLETVVTVYKKHKSKGWGAIAKELGIKPGSKEFKALKAGSDSMSSKVKHKRDKKDKERKK